MLRLYSSFAHGAPGAGLLLMRTVSGGTLVFCAAAAAFGRSPVLLPVFLCMAGAGMGLLLLVGLWTPVAGALAALLALWAAYLDPAHAAYYALLATLAAALALLGPGAFSVDARLFGWKRVEIGGGEKRPPLEDD